MRRHARRLALGLEAATALAVAQVAIRVLPASRVSRLMGRPFPAHPRAPAAPPPAAVRRVGVAVHRVARVLPWRPTCLPQAVATAAMLRRRGVAAWSHLGITATAPLEAHAWVTVNGHVVIGGPVAHATEVAAFR